MQAKRHHYVPKFLIDQFIDPEDGQIWTYDIEEKRSFKTSPINCSVMKHYYSFENEDGTKDDRIEKWLADIEGRAASIILKIKKGSFNLTVDELEILIYFVCLLEFRNPSFRNSVHKFKEYTWRIITSMLASDKNLLKTYLKKYEKETGDGDIGKLQELIADESSYKIEAHPNSSLELIIDMNNSIYNLIRQMNWLFVIAPRNASFILSDHPFSIVNPDIQAGRQIGLAMKETEIQVPLTPAICLVGSWNDLYGLPKPIHATKQMLDNINDVIQANAINYLYSKEEIEKVISTTDFASNIGRKKRREANLE